MLTDAQKIDLVARYKNGAKISVLAKEFGYKSHQGCWSFLKSRGVEIRNDNYQSNRRYHFDTHIFDQIDTEAKAYWLGFIYADGCHYEKRYSLLVGLACKDEDHLNKLSKFFSLTRPLYKRTDKAGHCHVLLTATDMHMSRSLTLLGVMSAKTFKLTFPTPKQVPDHLIHHFVRGYFDGDGSIWSSARNLGHKPSTCVSLVGTEAFIQRISDISLQVTGSAGSINTRHPQRKHNIRSWALSGNTVVGRLIDWMYRDATVFLDRKEIRAREFRKRETQYRKSIEQLDTTGAVVATYRTAHEAAEKTGFNYFGIQNLCNGSASRYDKKGRFKHKRTSYMGYGWRYASNPYAH